MTGTILFLHSVSYKMEESEQWMLADSTSQCGTEVGYFCAQYTLVWMCLLVKMPFALNFTCYEHAA
jgi:hypothetical protein